MPISNTRRRTSLAATIAFVGFGFAVALAGGQFKLSPHGSSLTGVWRVSEYPKGSCAQCHINHSATSGNDFSLFQQNSNRLCYAQSMGGCHADRPTGGTSGYPAQESDRMPTGSSDPGYFEVNVGGVRVPGVANLVRWPGQIIWEDALYNAHASDPDMPKKDAMGFGSCDNCHSVHGSASSHDMTDTTYRSVTNSQLGSVPTNYQQCFICHSSSGPAGMSQSSKSIADFYNSTLNGRRGHRIGNGGYVPSNARLSCSDCHNPHGSAGYSNLGPNGFLISDQRPGWYGLTDIRNDNTQVRRFCFGCHTSSDGLGGGTIHGLSAGSLPNEVPYHVYNGTKHCYDCHGRDYTSSSGNNVHNPSGGD